jgi:prepilin-type N-terminal cleavage/methylation domain-containing protein
MKKAFTLIELIIGLAIISLLAAIGIPNLLRARLVANESLAQGTLKSISTAFENYAAQSNNGLYPTAESQLTGITPPFLDKSYNGLTVNGYSYSYSMNNGAYSITASPANPGVTGTKTYRITNGGILTES